MKYYTFWRVKEKIFMVENPIIIDAKDLEESKRRKIESHSYKDLGYSQKLTVRIPQKNAFYVRVIKKRLNVQASDIYRYTLQTFIDMNFSKGNDGRYYRKINQADYQKKVNRTSICFLASKKRSNAVQTKCKRLGITFSAAFNTALYKVIAEQRK